VQSDIHTKEESSLGGREVDQQRGRSRFLKWTGNYEKKPFEVAEKVQMIHYQ